MGSLDVIVLPQRRFVAMGACKSALIASEVESVEGAASSRGVCLYSRTSDRCSVYRLLTESASNEWVHRGRCVMRSRIRYKGGCAQARDQLASTEE
jgi:hypothetical protein